MEVVAKQSKKKNKQIIQIREEKIKLSLFAHGMIV
jgi:hypothetical protein